MTLEVGLPIEIGGISAAFKQAINTVSLIQSTFDPRKIDPNFLALQYRIQLIRLDQWGAFCGLVDPIRPSLLSGMPENTRNLIMDILKCIENLKKDANFLVKKHNISLMAMDSSERIGGLSNSNTKLDSKPSTEPRILGVLAKFRSRVSWIRNEEHEFATILAKINDLTTRLENFVPECRLPVDALTASTLAKVNDKGQLEALSNSGDRISYSLAASARAKAIQTNALRPSETTKTLRIMAKNLTFETSSKFGILVNETNLRCSVWVEWNIIKVGPELRDYIRRVESLACLLQRVSEPVICLPPCHGIYEDERYEELHGCKRIGLIFGVPNVNGLNEEGSFNTVYDTDLQKSPPQTLANLIKARKGAHIPLLGERFQLAFTLAITFSYFHAAGWLHKGLGAESIIFFHQANGQEIDVTKPFITGFQFSRPQDGSSLSQGPLEDDKFNQYYHPDAHNGFTKQRDLYGLGVVLCEIGQWMLMADRVATPERRAKLTNRSAWRDLIVDGVLVDLGWRMGKYYQSAVQTLLLGDLPENDEFYAQQYLERIIRPLSRCIA